MTYICKLIEFFKVDVLRKELNAFYEGQRLAEESLDQSLLDECKIRVKVAVDVENDCRVITDAAEDFCYIYGGRFSTLIGLGDSGSYVKEMNSSDEDVIYNRIHPEDLVDKRMLEYEFFKFIDTQPAERKLDFKATCRFRILDRTGKYIYVNNSTRVLCLSPAGKVWLILCCYDLAPIQEPADRIEARIVDCTTGDIKLPGLSVNRSKLLTDREKEILNLIKEGKLSKQIADLLNISVHTVNRHRQNILEKLSVSNSVEAVTAATVMKLL